MKTSIIYVFSLLLLFFGCNIERQELVYSGYNGNRDCFTVRVQIPDKWKIVNAQLKTDQMIVEFNRGKRIKNRLFLFHSHLRNLVTTFNSEVHIG